MAEQSIIEFLSTLRALNVRVWADNGQLRVNAPDGVLTSDLRSDLKARKEEILGFLRHADTTGRKTLTIQPVSRESKLPLSFSQQRLWLLDQLEPNNPAYNIPATVRLTGALNVTALESSLNEIIRRHEVLRTTFASDGENVVQVIIPALSIPLPVRDLRQVQQDERENKARNLAMEEAGLPFDLVNGPLLRASLLRLEDDVYVLLLTLHHVVSDDWSLSVFVRELAALYPVYMDAKPSPLPELPIQYADFAAWQRNWLQGDVLEQQLDYWQDRLKDIDQVLPLPTDRPRPRVQTFRGERRYVMLPRAIVEQLKALSQQANCTLFMTLLAGFKVLLQQYMRQTDIVIGSPVAGRIHSEIEELIGFFVNTVVLRTDLGGNPTFRDVLARVRETTTSAYAQQAVPFEQVVDALRLQREGRQVPLFQVFFNMLNSTTQVMELPGLKIEPFSEFVVGAPNIGAKFDLTLVAVEYRDGLQLDFSYNTDLFEERTMVWLLEHFRTLLESVVANPDQPLMSLPQLPQAEYRLVQPVNEFEPFKKADIEQTITKRFEQQVERYPLRVAIDAQGKEVRYDELNRWANRVARVIQERSVGAVKLSRVEKTRYFRQMQLDGWGQEAQEKLKGTTVFVAGAGGTGSPVMMQLALCGVGTIIVCDFDQVELSNLNRQVLHDESRIGMNKALSAQKTLQIINPHVKVVACTEKITRENVYELVGDSAIIFDNVDDLETKFILSECAVIRQIPHIISSMIELTSYVAIFHAPHTPCFHCLYDRSRVEEINAMQAQASYRQRVANPVASPALFASTGFACNEAIKILLGLENPAYNKYFLFNQKGSSALVHTTGFQIVTYPFSDHFKKLSKGYGFDWEEGWSGKFVEEIPLERDPECPMCGEKAKAAGRSIFSIHIPEVSDAAQPHLVEYLEDRPEENPQTVALMLGHSAETVAGMLGALKAGKVYVALDPAYPEERLTTMLRDSDARLIVTNTHYQALAESIRNKVKKFIRIFNMDELDDNLSAENLHLDLSADQIAYIVYTSGSMGRPKGVMQNHRNVLHFTMNYTNGLHISQDDRLSLIPSFSFSAAMMDVYAALLNGARLCLYDITGKDGLAGLGEWLKTKRITVYHSVPTVFRHFVAALPAAITFPDLRLIDFGGEPVLSKDIELYKKHFAPECILVNGLGATELNVIRQFHIDKQTELGGDIVPAGYAVDDTKILLLDETGKEVGFNRPGEIVIKSEFLSPGYWEAPEQTADAFKPDPLGGMERFYHTGDLGRLRPDGCLEHLGRKDLQVKIHGVRIEPAEIEVVLLEFETVREAVVVARDSSDTGEKQLVAYIVPRHQGESLTSQLREALQAKFPPSMIPAHFVILTALPLTTTGKIDRRALPAVEQPQADTSGTFVGPRTQTEEKLAHIWGVILGKERVGVFDNFFELGGDSLRATRILLQVRQVFQSELPMRSLFEMPTVAELAAAIDSQAGSHIGELDELDAILREIENSSTDEVQAALMQQANEIQEA